MNTPKTSPKDFFLHLAAMIFLYSAVIALINLAFAIADRLWPDALQTFYGAGSLVWPISMLIVLVPVTYVLEWLIGRDILRLPEKRDIWIRRWRIYLTLFLTGVTIVIDLIALINVYLNGEISSRFIIKVLVVLVVCAVVFAYYILAKGGAPGSSRAWRLFLASLGIVLAVAAVVSGFFIVGSPAAQRAARFDQERVNDLQSIMYQIDGYWQRTGKLPDSLQAIDDPVMFKVPTDPESHAPYEYAQRAPDSFELCAVFDAPLITGASMVPPRTIPMGLSQPIGWQHAAGRVCFDEKVSKALYPAGIPK